MEPQWRLIASLEWPTMPNLSIKDVPEALAERLRQRAITKAAGELMLILTLAMASRKPARRMIDGPPSCSPPAYQDPGRSPTCAGAGLFPSTAGRSRSTSCAANAMPADRARQLIVAEPAPRPATRPPAVVDCSVIAAAVFAEAQCEQAWETLAGKSLHAPWLIDIEMGSVALRKSHPRESDVARAGLGHFEDMTSPGIDVTALVQLASRYQLTAYDAAYLLVASELRAPLLTFDQKLGSAARRHLASLS
jgi:predicted nucleic acid-binding protein